MSSSTPDHPPSRPALPAYDLQACRALMRGGSKTFFAASLLLPARVRAPASALYAFCRLADDEIDLLRPHIKFLEQKGFAVTAVSSGEGALAALERAGFSDVRRHVELGIFSEYSARVPLPS